MKVLIFERKLFQRGHMLSALLKAREEAPVLIHTASDSTQVIDLVKKHSYEVISLCGIFDLRLLSDLEGFNPNCSIIFYFDDDSQLPSADALRAMCYKIEFRKKAVLQASEGCLTFPQWAELCSNLLKERQEKVISQESDTSA